MFTHLNLFDVPDQQLLIDFLKQPGSYPHKPEQVEHLQTHISHVFIAPPYVYKLKKPLDLGFLDFSTIEKRKYFCEQEVKLNRRLCNEIYLGVICVTGSRGSCNFIPISEEPDNPVDYMVKMKLLQNEHFLIRKVKEGNLKREHLEQVAHRLADFYSEQKTVPDILKYGEPSVISYNTDENFNQTKEFIGKTIDDRAYRAIRYFTNKFLGRGDDLFQKRIKEKRIIDGHGDLHLEHINLSENGICIYDCIEFNERFRYQDIAADLAFLAMDLDFHHLQRESIHFMNLMSFLLNDPDLTRMADFYKCYRAYVRGKVKSIESSEEEVSAGEQAKAVEKASRYFRLSLCYALFGSKPTVLIIMGRTASGKSTLAKLLSDYTDIAYFSTDIIRKTLARIPLTQRLPDQKRSRLYSREMTEKTYQNLTEDGMSELREYKSVVLDGTFSSAADRKKVIDKVEKFDYDYLFIEVEASEHVRENRLRQRDNESGIISDARAEEMSLIDGKYQPPVEIEENHLIRIDTSKEVQDSLEDLFLILVERNLNRLLDD